jgi:AraC-like DNA-binding protein
MGLAGFSILAQLLAGFSVCAAALLLFAYLFFLPHLRKTLHGKWACAALLMGLAAMQIAHFSYFDSGVDLLSDRRYLFLLMVAPVSFYFFSRSVLFLEDRASLRDFLHFLPLSLTLLMPLNMVPSAAFLIGAGYTFWFAQRVYELRGHSQRFRFEMFFFGMFALMAVLSLMLGLALPSINPAVFFQVYTTLIGIALLFVMAALIVFPELLSDIVEISAAAYEKSKLDNLNVRRLLMQLETAMRDDKVFEDENLSLATLAEQLKINGHQLSELVNRHLSMSVPQYIRGHRVAEAKRLMAEEPQASILSISMATGFKSQSSFYTAFREATGVAPGQYRQRADHE